MSYMRSGEGVSAAHEGTIGVLATGEQGDLHNSARCGGVCGVLGSGGGVGQRALAVTPSGSPPPAKAAAPARGSCGPRPPPPINGAEGRPPLAGSFSADAFWEGCCGAFVGRDSGGGVISSPGAFLAGCCGAFPGRDSGGGVISSPGGCKPAWSACGTRCCGVTGKGEGFSPMSWQDASWAATAQAEDGGGRSWSAKRSFRTPE